MGKCEYELMVKRFPDFETMPCGAQLHHAGAEPNDDGGQYC